MNTPTELSLLALAAYDIPLNADGAEFAGYTSVGIGGFDVAGAAASGFGAVAFQKGNEIVISFRGTNAGPFGDLLTDAVNGWGVGAGSPYGDQLEYALKFYQAVSASFPGASIALTGHSLGGGLAGFISAV